MLCDTEQILARRTRANPWRDRDFWAVVAAIICTRVLFVIATQGFEPSSDVASWVLDVDMLRHGANPYAASATPFAWPPLWMQILYAIDVVARLLHVSLASALRCFLVGMEVVVADSVYRIWCQVRPEENPSRAIFWGIALNPVCLLLAVQHCNFDILVGWLSLVCIGWMASYVRTADPVEWLLACLFAGLAILAKTVPVVLLPVLVFGVRKLDGKTRLLGALLALGPVALGMSIIYVLAPEAVTRNVVMYRSYAGGFGLTGLPYWVGCDFVATWVIRGFAPCVLIVMACISAFAWNARSVRPRQVILLGTALLLAIPTLGPGYAPQYAYWWIPLMVVSYGLLGPRPRRFLAWGFVVAGITYVVDYAFVPSFGQLANGLFRNSAIVRHIADVICPDANQALATLPLFLMMLLALGVLIADCRVSRNVIQEPRAAD